MITSSSVASVKVVVALTTVERVISGIAVNGIVAAAGHQNICARAAGDEIIALLAQ